MRLRFVSLLLLAGTSTAALGQEASTPLIDPTPGSDDRTEETVQRSSVASDIVVTARRRQEQVQDVPIPISVVGVKELDNTGSFNVSRLQQLQPSLQFYSTNPRNSSVNIRGLGAPLGLTNDGIDQGVGVYIDQVYLRARLIIRVLRYGVSCA